MISLFSANSSSRSNSHYFDIAKKQRNLFQLNPKGRQKQVKGAHLQLPKQSKPSGVLSKNASVQR